MAAINTRVSEVDAYITWRLDQDEDADIGADAYRQYLLDNQNAELLEKIEEIVAGQRGYGREKYDAYDQIAALIREARE